ncbi:MAG: tetratricopeptide repeat protein [Vampirovibrionales bacterium]
MTLLAPQIDAIQAGQGFSVDLSSTYTAFELVGKDVVDYLQRRTSNDVKALKVDETQVNSFLTKTSSIQCLFQLWKTGDDAFFALVETPLAETFEAEVLKFKIMECFELKRLDLPLTLVIHPTEPLKTGEKAFQNPMILLAKSATHACLATSPLDDVSLETLSTEAFQDLQTLCGVPRYGVDYTQDTKLPETAWEDFAVSYTKGCFLGQETLAKVKTYGGLKQTLLGVWMPNVSLESLQIDPQSPVLLNNETGDAQEIGTWGRAVSLESGVYALAYLHRSFRKLGESLGLAINTARIEAKVDLPPYLNLSADAHEKAQRLYESAMKEFVEGDLDASITAMRRLVEAYPQFWQAQEGLAVLLGRAERYDEAMQVLKALIAQNPDWVMAYTNLSIYALRLGSKEEAETWKAEGTRVAMRLKMAEVMAQKQAMQGDATAEARRLKEAEEAHQKRQEQLVERVSLFDQALAFSPNDALAHYGKATALHELERYAEAANAYEQTVSLNPKQSKAYVGWAECLDALGHHDALRNVVQAGIDVASQRGDLQPLARLKELQK